MPQENEMEIRGQIDYYLSEQGRRDSLLKGGNGHFEQTMFGSINEKDIELFSVDASGLVSFDATTTALFWWKASVPASKGHVVTQENGGVPQIHWDIVPSWEDLLAIARQVKAQNDEMEAEDEAVRTKHEQIGEAFINNPEARATKVEQHHVIVDGKRFGEMHPVWFEARKRWKRDQEELKQRNRATLAEWIQQFGDENQQQRLAAQLLPWQEAYDSAEEWFYAHLLPFQQYQRFTSDEVCECARNGGTFCEIKFQSIDATELTADEWERFSEIQAAAPDATFQFREHRARCATAAAPIVRRGVIVKFTMGELGFKREFALGGTHDGY
jgi:hypothetical protein